MNAQIRGLNAAPKTLLVICHPPITSVTKAAGKNTKTSLNTQRIGNVTQYIILPNVEVGRTAGGVVNTSS